MAKKYTEEEIVAYLKGEMGIQEQDAFNQQLEWDEDLLERVKLQRAEKRIRDWAITEAVMENKNHWINMARAALEEDNPPDQIPLADKRNRWPIWLISLITLGVIGFFLFKLLTNTSVSDQPVATIHELLESKNVEERLAYVPEIQRSTPKLSIDLRGDQLLLPKSDLKIALDEYAINSYQKAIEIIEVMDDESLVTLEIEAYSYFGLGNYEKTIPLLKRLNQNQEENIKHRANWYLLLSYLATYDSQAKSFNSLLEQISQTPESAYHDAADKLKKKISLN